MILNRYQKCTLLAQTVDIAEFIQSGKKYKGRVGSQMANGNIEARYAQHAGFNP